MCISGNVELFVESIKYFPPFGERQAQCTGLVQQAPAASVLFVQKTVKLMNSTTSS